MVIRCSANPCIIVRHTAWYVLKYGYDLTAAVADIFGLSFQAFECFDAAEAFAPRDSDLFLHRQASGQPP